MTLKQSLKLDWRKIVLFVLFSVVFLLEYSPSGCGPNGLIRFLLPLNLFNMIHFPLIWLCRIFTIFDLISGLIGMISYIFALLIGPIGLVFGYVFIIIYAYLLSCLIIWIYDKVKMK